MTKSNDFDKNKKVLDNFLKGKLPASIKDYTKVEQKTTGVSAGFIAESDIDKAMIKPGDMNTSGKRKIKNQRKKVKALMLDNPAKTKTKNEGKTLKLMQSKIQDKGDMLREYMAPFDRFLYQNTAQIGLATDKSIANFKDQQETPETLFVRSKFIEGFEPLDNYMFYDIRISKDINNEVPIKTELLIGLQGEGVDRELVLKNSSGQIKEVLISKSDIQAGITRTDYNYLNSNIDTINELEPGMVKSLKKYAINQFGYVRSEEIQKTQGLEKALAACMFLGDSDYHGGNLGIVDRNGDKSIVKLDHGRAYYFNNDEDRLRKDLHFRLNQYNYQGMQVDAALLKDSIDEMTKISDQEIKTIVRKRSYDLKKMGFKLDDTLKYYENNKLIPLAPSSKLAKTDNLRISSRYFNMEKNYINLYKKQKQALIQFSQDLDVVLKIDMPEAWKKRDWIHEMKGDKPLNWAIDNHKTIQDIDPKIWGVLSGQREDPNIKKEDIDPVLKFKFYMANKNFDMAKAEIPNIKTFIDHDISALATEAKKSGRKEIEGLLEERFSATIVADLFTATKSGKNEKAMQLLNKVNDINIENSGGLRIIHIASATGNKELVDFLIKKKANLNLDHKGTTALQLALSKGHSEIATTLINNGADVNIANNAKITALHIAASTGKAGIVNQLINKGAKIDELSGDGTALNIALNKGHIEVANILISKGADLNIKNKNGITSLELAVSKGYSEVIDTITQMKAIEDQQKNIKETTLKDITNPPVRNKRFSSVSFDGMTDVSSNNTSIAPSPTISPLPSSPRSSSRGYSPMSQ